MQLKHYVINCEDTRACPNAKCNYYGLVQIDQYTERIECDKPLQCPECQTEWCDPLQQVTRGASLIGKFIRLKKTWQQTATNLRELLISEPCPNCGSMIQKNGGCKHMVCYKCKYEFCWLCLGHYKRYRHDPGMEKYCGQASSSYFLAMFMCYLSVAWKLLTSVISASTINAIWSYLPSLTFGSVLYGLSIFIYANGLAALLVVITFRYIINATSQVPYRCLILASGILLQWLCSDF